MPAQRWLRLRQPFLAVLDLFLLLLPLLLLLLLGMASPSAAEPNRPVIFHVAPGPTDAPSDCTADRPFDSLRAAQLAVRKALASTDDHLTAC